MNNTEIEIEVGTPTGGMHIVVAKPLAKAFKQMLHAKLNLAKAIDADTENVLLEPEQFKLLFDCFKALRDVTDDIRLLGYSAEVTVNNV